MIKSRDNFLGSLISNTHLRDAVPEHSAGIGVIAEDTGLFPASMVSQMMQGCFSRPDEAFLLVAESADSMLGFAYCELERLTSGTWNLRAIGVAPKCHRSGVGTALLRRVEKKIIALGGRVIIIETTDETAQAPARALYAASGYAKEAYIRDFWDAGVAKVVFWKHC
ncbi:GNAT family N-acetyltransferase [Bradyrhizobium diazoefficiens]|nr:GNAT family N-acetyltransferase [Bradyrhizobium diazoefficiens]UCF53755.1 MAG: GNAT family N-acetyltransferase [Bradyrhizobium sp.]MBR0963107.1 GNAT family N-acetyltransferase [Bradyrhizobium diazoefficiens]MBR0977267.1 GNAT family N-acetyltransferase [Bradyrhizobium diazoefficiens]MBR1005912.1 GNAT family N-acetyltransferase [Bradyrhizobium diazoefficiens]MBR1012385.1 GNAT family N-acetyltransferase [Bradyrhizobium diazoefficiens]